MPLNAKLAMYVMPAERATLGQTTDFYTHLFGIKFCRTLTDLVKVMHTPISIDGAMFCVEGRERQPGEEAIPFAVFVVDSLDESEKELHELGGQFIGERFVLPMDERVMPVHREEMLGIGRHESQITSKIGIMRMMTDPSGNMLALLQIDADSQYWFKTGPYRIGLTVNQMAQWERECELADSLDLEPI